MSPSIPEIRERPVGLDGGHVVLRTALRQFREQVLPLFRPFRGDHRLGDQHRRFLFFLSSITLQFIFSPMNTEMSGTCRVSTWPEGMNPRWLWTPSRARLDSPPRSGPR